jgi:hypothetical protein
MGFRILSILVLSLAVTTLSHAQVPAVSAAGQQCLDCHSSSTPGIVEQWQSSAHAKKGIDCYSCHKAAANDPSTFDHYGQRIAVIVTPNYCARGTPAKPRNSKRAITPQPQNSSARSTICSAKSSKAVPPRRTAAVNATVAK